MFVSLSLCVSSARSLFFLSSTCSVILVYFDFSLYFDSHFMHGQVQKLFRSVMNVMNRMAQTTVAAAAGAVAAGAA